MNLRRAVRGTGAARWIAFGLPVLAGLLSLHQRVDEDGEQCAAATAWHRVAEDPTAPFPRAGDYVGKDTCRDCHGDQWDAISEGVHRSAIHAPGTVGCETCHGPGRLHAEDADNDPKLITHPPSLPPSHQSRICVQCHRAQMATHGGEPVGFLIAGKGCTACHTVHEPTPPVPQRGLVFASRARADRGAQPTGAGKCVACHPRRDQLLEASPHASLAAAHSEQGCESCHGNGSLHVATNGLGRLITRPDHARDGAATCRSCHADVDEEQFHWRDRPAPLLSRGLTCTSCHTVHAAEMAGAPIDQDTGAEAPQPGTNALCQKCHAPAFTQPETVNTAAGGTKPAPGHPRGLLGTVHAPLAKPDAPLAAGCGACHSGAEAHALSGGRRDLVDALRTADAKQQEQTCMKCHGREESLRHHRVGAHARHDVGCLSCHSTGAPIGKVRDDAERRCSTCHTDVAAEFRLPNHHPVPEGAMGCSDCHNPHSARPRIRDLVLKQEVCVDCHRQYRGPFVFAHQASRLDGCVVCHVPHGSPNRRLLQQHNTQQNCLQCHADYPSFHDQTPGAVFTNCLNCHTQVHGSNHSRFLFR